MFGPAEGISFYGPVASHSRQLSEKTTSLLFSALIFFTGMPALYLRGKECQGVLCADLF